MKIRQFLTNMYQSSVLSKCVRTIAGGYEDSFLFSLNRAGVLDDSLGESIVIPREKAAKEFNQGKILPALYDCAERLTKISARELALILAFYLLSSSISGFIDQSFTRAVMFLGLELFVLPLFFTKRSFASVLGGSVIGRFFGFPHDVPAVPQNKTFILLTSIFGVIGGMFLPFPYSALLFLAPVALVMLTYIKPIGFVCLMMLCLSLFGTSACIVLCVLLLISQWLQRFYGTVKKTRIDYIDVLLFVYVLLCIISSLFSYAIGDSFRVSLMWLIMFSVVFIIIRNIKCRKDLIMVLTWLLIGAVVASAIGLYQYLSGQVDTTWTDTELFEDLSIRIYSTFANPNVFGEFLLLVIPLAAGLGIYFKEWKYKISCFVTLGLTLVALALTYSRGCYVGVAVTALVFLWMYNKKILGILLVIGVPIGITMLPQNMIDRILSMVNLSDSSTSYRLKIYEGTFELLKTFWPSGVGIGETAFNCVYPVFGIQGIVAPHSHSLFLQLMTSFGIAGLIYFAFLMFVYHRNLISFEKKLHRNDRRKILLITFGSVLFGFLVQSVFDYTWYNYRVYFLFWIVVALGFATYKVLRGEGAQHD